MKKVLLIIVCCFFFCGCEKDKKINNEKKINNTKYTFCYASYTNGHTSWSIYYDENYNISKDLILISETYDTLSEALNQEISKTEKCNNVKENIDCSVYRSDKVVDIGYTNYKPEYDYLDKIEELENIGFECEEVTNN